MNSSYGMAGIAAIVLAACAAQPGPAGTATGDDTASVTTSPCSGPDKDILINRVTISPDGTTATLRVPDNVNIKKNAVGVRWKLAGGNRYAFTNDGIVFKASAPPVPASAAPSTDLSEYRWCFNTPTTGDVTWPYTINFYDTRAAIKRTWICDPTIANFDTGLTLATVTVTCR